jgi:hypothetical protein
MAKQYRLPTPIEESTASCTLEEENLRSEPPDGWVPQPNQRHRSARMIADDDENNDSREVNAGEGEKSTTHSRTIAEAVMDCGTVSVIDDVLWIGELCQGQR